MNHDVFISYSRRNYDMVMEVKRQIDNDVGTECWIDLNGIESGSERFEKDIIGGINASQVFLFMLSAESQQSEYALLELHFAKRKGKRIVLVNIDDSTMTDEFFFKYSLTDTIAWRNQPQRNKLLRDLRCWIGKGEEQQKEEADRKAKAEADRKAKEEADRKAREEAERKAKEEVDLKAKEEAERKVKEEADRKAKEEADRKAKEEADRKAKEDAYSKGSAKGKAKEDDKYVVVGTGKMVLEKEDVPRDATHIRIAEGIKTINYSAFEGCNSMVSVIIPKGVTEIRGNAFSGCESLMSVVIPHGVTEIGGFAFFKCINLTSVVIPEGVTIIHIGAFCSCNNLSVVVIPESVKEIGKQAFLFCVGLKTVRLLNPNTKYKKHSLLGVSNTFDDQTEIIKGKI
ncbi:MAG: leucine-rich repeat protein [Bacteroidales bacterium]|nr:leucine-rich repeat protein [Bacteroidales bacterium]